MYLTQMFPISPPDLKSFAHVFYKFLEDVAECGANSVH